VIQKMAKTREHMKRRKLAPVEGRLGSRPGISPILMSGNLSCRMPEMFFRLSSNSDGFSEVVAVSAGEMADEEVATDGAAVKGKSSILAPGSQFLKRKRH